MFKRILFVTIPLLTLAACTPSKQTKPMDAPPPPPVAATSTAPHAQIGAFGLDLTDRDPGVKPGDDFFRYAIGHWLDTHQIPADRSSWSTFAMLDDESEKRQKGLIEGLPKDAAPGSAEQKVGDFYRSFMNTDAIERAGLAPVQGVFKAIDAARSYADIAQLIGRPDLPLMGPIGIGIDVDEKNPDRYIVGIGQSGLGLPDRDYYLKDDAALKDIREKYQAHIAHMLSLAGEKNAGSQAKQIVALETRIAKLHWPVAKRRERDLTYNLRTRDELKKLAPQYPFAQQLAAGGLAGQQEFVVAELDAVQKLGQSFRKTPIGVWHSYLKYHFLAASANVLPKAIDTEDFDFYGRTLNGQQQQRERWKRAVDAVDSALGEAVGELYVARYFPPDSKAKMQDLVENLRAAYASRVRQLPWMTETTKKVAQGKLGTFRPKIGYPDKWRDYSKLDVQAGDAFGNELRAASFAWHHDADRLGQPTDRDEWGMTPQTVNAYYNPTFNEIVFPAAILQPPFFDPNADPAVNYGAIGGVIGHEMGHGFDDQGAKSDARGILRTWWQPADEASFKKLVDSLADQYSGYTALPGLNVNGRLTLGENIGDLGGLTVAYAAYHLSLNGKEAPVIDGLTGDQRFFLSWAQAWRSLYREQSLRNLVMSNPHSPPQFRVNGVVRNMDAWYQAFDVKPGDKLYLPPEQRVRIW